MVPSLRSHLLRRPDLIGWRRATQWRLGPGQSQGSRRGTSMSARVPSRCLGAKYRNGRVKSDRNESNQGRIGRNLAPKQRIVSPACS